MGTQGRTLLSWRSHAPLRMVFATLLAVGSLALTLPSGLDGAATVGRREALLRLSVAGAALTTAAPRASAEMYGMGKEAKVPVSESVAKAKAYKYEARPVAGNESSQFLEAEKKRKAAALAREQGMKPKEESTAETMARLGLKAYGS